MNHSTSSKNYREARLFFSCQILNVGYVLFFFHLVTHQHQFIFGNLEKNPVEVEERCPLIGRGMEIHDGNPFFVKFRSQSNTEK